MNRTLRSLIAAIGVALAFGNTATFAQSADETAIREQLQRYERALNASDVDSVMRLYANDAVFMPQHSPPAVGRDAVRTTYENIFKAIKLDIRFEIDEVKTLSSTAAYARTRSTGTVKVLGTELSPAPEANQELFLLHKEADGQWRFARYIFATTNPPRKH